MEKAVEKSSEKGEDMEGSISIEDFVASGRTGRRNAMPDILNSNHAGVGTGGLAEDMEKLNCSDQGQGSSSNNPPTDKTGKGS